MLVPDVLNLIVNNISFEAVERENEVEVYTDKLSIDKIKTLATSVVGQEQFGLKVKASHDENLSLRMRVRSNHRPEEDPEYEYTIKMKDKKGIDTEINIPIDINTFNVIKGIADSGMIKTRYTVPTNLKDIQVTLEIDVFEKTDWIKIDIELPGEITTGKKAVLDSLGVLGLSKEDVIIITPRDKINKTEDSKRVQGIIDDTCIIRPPFK